DAVDLWTGGLAENHTQGAAIGETFGKIIADQFTALRDGDRLYFENQGFDPQTLKEIKSTTLGHYRARYDRHNRDAGRCVRINRAALRHTWRRGSDRGRCGERSGSTGGRVPRHRYVDRWKSERHLGGSKWTHDHDRWCRR